MNYLVLSPHSPGGDPVVEGLPGVVVVTALGEQRLDVALVLKDQVEVTLGWGGVVSARPLHSHLSELSECLDQRWLRDVPRHPAQEDLGGVGRVGSSQCSAVRQLTRPGAGGLAGAGSAPVQPGSSLQVMRVGQSRLSAIIGGVACVGGASRSDVA